MPRLTVRVGCALGCLQVLSLHARFGSAPDHASMQILCDDGRVIVLVDVAPLVTFWHKGRLPPLA
jgi:hypothetical protein